MPKRNYSNTAVPQVLGAAVTTTATTLSVGSVAGFPPVPFLLGLERGTANEEVVLCTAKDTAANTFTVTRAYDGTTAKSHAVGALVEHTVAAIDYREGSIQEFTTAERDALAGTDRWVGRVIFNTTANQFQGWDGTTWGPLGGGGAATQTAEPAGTNDGALWYDTDEPVPSAFGTTDAETLLVRGVLHENHARSVTNTYTSGKLTRVEEKSGTTVVRTTNLTYTGDQLTSMTEAAGGVTVTTTFTYDGSGNLTGTTRSVA